MIWGEIEMGKEIRPNYAVLYISNCKIEFKICLPYGDSAGKTAEAPNLSTVSGAQLWSGGSQAALLASGRYDRKQGASIDEPLLISSAVNDVK